MWLCALCYLEQGFTGWNVPAPLMLVTKRWGGTPSISLDPVSALHQFVQQLMVKQHAENNGHKRVKVAPVRPALAQPCFKELKLLGRPVKKTECQLFEKGHRESILGFTGKRDGVLMKIRVRQTTNTQGHQMERAEKAFLQRTAESDAVLKLEKEAERYGIILWVISFHRVCLLVTMGLLARVTVRILLQVKQKTVEKKANSKTRVIRFKMDSRFYVCHSLETNMCGTYSCCCMADMCHLYSNRRQSRVRDRQSGICLRAALVL